MNVEQEIADLKRRVHALEHTSRPPRSALPPQQQVTITQVAETNSRFVMPRDAELHALQLIVLERHPYLKARDLSPEETYRGFADAFEYLGHTGRTATINNSRELLSWVQDASSGCPNADDRRA